MSQCSTTHRAAIDYCQLFLKTWSAWTKQQILGVLSVCLTQRNSRCEGLDSVKIWPQGCLWIWNELKWYEKLWKIVTLAFRGFHLWKMFGFSWIFQVEDYKLLVAVSPMVSRPSLVGFLQEFLDRFGTRIYAKFGQHQRVWCLRCCCDKVEMLFEMPVECHFETSKWNANCASVKPPRVIVPVFENF